MPVSQRWLRAVVVLGPVVALLAAAPAGGTPPWWLVVAVAGVSGGFALAPESAAGPIVMGAVVVWWARAPDDLLHGSCLLAAVSLLAAHLAALVAGYGPPATPVDRAVLRLWSRRGAMVAAVAPVLWVLAVALRDGEAPSGLWPAGLAVAIVVTVAATVRLGATERTSTPS